MEYTGAILSDDVFNKLKELIYELSGLYFGEQKKYLLETRLSKRLSVLNLSNFDDYYNYLKYSPEKTSEAKELLNSVTTNETSFFRDMPQLEVFVDILKQVVQSAGKNAYKKIRIWSAACSTGEEPYTVGILIKENFPSSDINFEIIGSDISTQVLDSANKGIYGSYTLRNASAEILKKYFVKMDDDLYGINDEIKKITSFRNVNLIDAKEVKKLNEFDVVLCRNVIIYFDAESKKKSITNIYESLKKGGYLFLGHSESLHSVTSLFKLVGFGKTPLYKKE
ncbi:MAG: protein-glutamate O-methyltransferase CheR [Deltaproteobacteria bacterium]|jgi:chemotaxis protein methyltransferase CheR|nr:protein-glutamate O-methyltransferase CheR [Deltaproteobacteria bacterium]